MKGRARKLALSRIAVRAQGPLEVRFLPAPGRLGAATFAHVRLPPGAAHPSIRHRRTDELAYVLSGSGSGVIDGRRLRLRPGDVLLIPAGSAHAFRAGPRGLDVLSVFAPALDLRDPDIVYDAPAGERRRA